MTADHVTNLAVVVPAHNEEALLPDCLAALRAAVERVRRRVALVTVHLVLDACTDASAAIAAASTLGVSVVNARAVGVARTVGVAAALRAHPRVASSRLWTAHTDADSVVPAHWLEHQIELAAAGADVIVGTVRPDFRDLTRAQTDAWWATHTPGVANGHVHGANLGIRASTLLAAGGFDPVPEHEDVRLVDRAAGIGARITASDDAWVQTSGRPVGRTAGGYAAYLREKLVPLAARDVGDTTEGPTAQPDDASVQAVAG
ncbi:glycosyltransferase [Microbacterium sp. NPDC078428]|uniref:glycosyltransferase n=1 Tax=Microbacterium sp. NPDC078428 TaxID=3364190 RepID=UPI0037C8D39E